MATGFAQGAAVAFVNKFYDAEEDVVPRRVDLAAARERGRVAKVERVPLFGADFAGLESTLCGRLHQVATTKL